MTAFQRFYLLALGAGVIAIGAAVNPAVCIPGAFFILLALIF